MSRVPLASFRFPVPAIRLPQWLELTSNSELILFVADFFHPVDWMAICLKTVAVVATSLDYC